MDDFHDGCPVLKVYPRTLYIRSKFRRARLFPEQGEYVQIRPAGCEANKIAAERAGCPRENDSMNKWVHGI
jgi:hypothetical protein